LKPIADKKALKLRQTYRRTLKKLILAQRFRHHPKNYGKARKAARKLKIIAGRLTRELKRKLSVAVFQQYSALFGIFEFGELGTRSGFERNSAIYILRITNLIFCLSLLLC